MRRGFFLSLQFAHGQNAETLCMRALATEATEHATSTFNLTISSSGIFRTRPLKVSVSATLISALLIVSKPDVGVATPMLTNSGSSFLVFSMVNFALEFKEFSQHLE